MTDRLRAVLDTNVFLSAFLSRSPSSPTREILQRWQAGEFVLVVSDALIDELTEKFLANKIDPARVTDFLSLLGSLAEWPLNRSCYTLLPRLVSRLHPFPHICRI